MCFNDDELEVPEPVGFQQTYNPDDLDPVEVEKRGEKLVEQYGLEHSKSCWVKGCGATIIPGVDKQDPPYGFKCPVCGASHKHHPELGVGMAFDRIDNKNYEKWLVFRRHNNGLY